MHLFTVRCKQNLSLYSLNSIQPCMAISYESEMKALGIKVMLAKGKLLE